MQFRLSESIQRGVGLSSYAFFVLVVTLWGGGAIYYHFYNSKLP